MLLFVVLGSSLAVFGAWGILVFVLAVGLAIYIREAKTPWSLPHVVLLALCLMCVLGWLLLPFVSVERDANRRASCCNKLHQIALALQGYHEANGRFPPAYIADNNGKPILSWRVLMLPFMEYDHLYRGLDFAQPWDGPKNKTLLATQLKECQCPSDANVYAPGVAQTNYVAVVGPNAAWAGEKPRKHADFGNDASHTIMLVEVAKGIPWMEPRDLSLESFGPDYGKSPVIVPVHRYGYSDNFFFKYDHGAGMHVATVDGSVRFLRTDNLSPDDLRESLQIGGCKPGTIGARALMTDETGRRPNWPNIAALAVWLLSVGTLLTRPREAATRGSLRRPRDSRIWLVV